MNAFLALDAWPDVRPAFTALREAGIRLALLANLSDRVMLAGLRNARLGELMEAPLSTDRVRVYKPHPRAYQMGPDAFGLPAERIGFVAFGGWDAAGAKAFGHPVFWANRAAQAGEELGLEVDAEGRSFEALLPWVLHRRR
jgi:2-haloacid dehalogenase